MKKITNENTRKDFQNKINKIIFNKKNVEQKKKIDNDTKKKEVVQKHKINIKNDKVRNTNKPNVIFKSDIKIKPTTVFYSGGIGDVLTIESFIPEEVKSKINTIVYGTRQSKIIKFMLENLPNYKIKKHVIAWDDFSEFWCFYHKKECIERLVKNKQEPPVELLEAEDYGITPKFRKLTLEDFTGSSFIKNKIADIKKFNLPKDYIVITPFSNNKVTNTRDFDKNDWEGTFNFLKHKNMPGVIVYEGKEPMPKRTNLINLASTSNILESIEILKNAKGYVGIDSALSVLAAQLFTSDNILVKSVNAHCYTWKHVYYAPQTQFDFMRRDIRWN